MFLGTPNPGNTYNVGMLLPLIAAAIAFTVIFGGLVYAGLRLNSLRIRVETAGDRLRRVL